MDTNKPKKGSKNMGREFNYAYLIPYGVCLVIIALAIYVLLQAINGKYRLA
jgi:hypothetical protein